MASQEGLLAEFGQGTRGSADKAAPIPAGPGFKTAGQQAEELVCSYYIVSTRVLRKLEYKIMKLEQLEESRAKERVEVHLHTVHS